MATITWGGSSTFWSNAASWIGGLVPTNADSAIINAGTANNLSAASALSVQIENSGQVRSNANLTVGLSIGVGNGASGTASLSVTGGTTSAGIGVQIGNTAGNGGTVSVSGTGILQAPTIGVGNAATSSLTVSRGGTVNASSGITAGNGATTGAIFIGGQALADTAGTINANISFANAGSSLRFRTSDTATYGGNLSGAGGVRVESAGQTAILTGTNSHSGATTITEGTLQIGNNGTTGTLGSGAVSIAVGATLAFQHSDGQYINANVISGAGNVVQRGSRQSLESLTANNSYTGTTTIDGTNLAVGLFGTTGTLGTGNVILMNNAELDLIRSDTQVIANTITGAGRVRIYGNHTVVLTGANTYSGTSEIFGGTNTLQIGNGGTTGSLGSGAVTIGTGGTLAFQHSDGQYVNANVISGAGNLVQRGSGGSLEVLTGNNSYTGTTTIDDGVLAIGFGGTTGTLGTGNVILMNGGDIDLIRSDTQVIANTITGAGNVRVYGNHTAVLTGANTYSGTSVIFDGANTLQVGNGGTGGSLGTSNVSIGAGATLAFQHSAGGYTNANVISGAGNVVHRGTGSTEILTGNNSYTGITTINSGNTLQIGNGGGSGTLGSGSVTNNGTLAFNRSTDSSVAGVISGTGGLVKDGGGDVYLTAANTYAGTTTINAGRINIGSIGGNGTTGSIGTGAVIIAGANAEFNYFRSNDATIANAISGIGSFIKTGISVLTLTGLDTHSGVTQISGGTLRGGGTNVFSANSLVSITTGARLDLGGFNQTIGGLSGSGIVENSGSATFRSLTLNVSGASTFAGVIQNGAGSSGLIKTGTGTQTLSGVNTYTSNTNVDGGTLALTGSGSIAGFVQVNNTARFDISGISGASTAVRDVLINSGGQIILGGKTLNVIGAVSNAGAGAFVGSAGTDAVIFTVSNNTFTLAGTNGATFTNWTDGIDSITINGNANANTLTGDELRATIINGGDGADIITGGAGNDRLNGGAGIDTISYANSTFGVTVHLNDPTRQNTVQQGLDTISGFENILGSNADDRLFGDNNDNVITAGGGFDTLVSGGGTNTLIGGTGGDIYFVQGVNDIVTEGVGGGYDIVLSQVNFTLAAGSEVEALAVNTTAGISLIGNEFGQNLTGNAGSDTLNGGGGNDLIISGGGTNTLIGGTGADIYYAQGLNDVVTEDAGGGFDVVLASGSLTLAAGSEVEVIAVNTASGVTITGSNTNQTILGGAGNDRLIGGRGNDTLLGSGGADTFVLLNTNADRDFIRDFTSGTDKLEISAALFGGGLAAGILSASQFRSGAGIDTASTAAHRFIYNSSTGNLWFDADGSGAGASVLMGNLTSVPTLTAADFLIAV